MNKNELNRLATDSSRAINEEIHLINEVYKKPFEAILHVEVAKCKRAMEMAARQGQFDTEIIVPSYVVDELTAILDEFNPTLLETYKLRLSWKC